MNLLQERHFVAIDFEGTGAVSGYADEPWQIGLVSISGGALAPEGMFESFLAVGDRPFSPYAPGRHAQYRELLANAPRLPQIWPQIRPRLEGVIPVAHNAATEQRYLHAAFPLHPPGQWLDTLPLSRKAYPGLRSYKLEDLIPTLGLQMPLTALLPDREPHDALYDALACALLLCHLLTLPGWNMRTCDELFAIQQPASRRSA